MSKQRLFQTFTKLNEVQEQTTDDCCLTLSDCETICSQAIKKSEDLNTLMDIAIVDHTGELLHFTRMPGAWVGSIKISQAKAYTAFAFSGDKDKQGPLSTAELGKLAQPGEPLFGIQNSNLDKEIIIFGGGIPLYKDGILVGAVGISGSTVDNDVKVAKASVKGFE